MSDNTDILLKMGGFFQPLWPLLEWWQKIDCNIKTVFRNLVMCSVVLSNAFRICAKNFFFVSLKHFLRSCLCNFCFLYKYKTSEQTQLNSKSPHLFLSTWIHVYNGYTFNQGIVLWLFIAHSSVCLLKRWQMVVSFKFQRGQFNLGLLWLC